MKRTQVGKIVSDKMQETAVIEVVVWKTHRVFGKRYQRNHRFMAHNPANTYKLGDTVEIAETRPISRHKSWLIVRKIEGNK